MIPLTPASTSVGHSARTPQTLTTDPEARLDKKAKGQVTKLSYPGHELMENRHGPVVETQATQATGTAKWGGSGDGGERSWPASGHLGGRQE